MLAVPLQAVPSQTVYATLNGQATQVNVYTTAFGLFADVLVAGAQVIGGVLCQNLNPIVRDAYLGFSGDLVFLDTVGYTDPVYPVLADRYTLVYLYPQDVPST